MLWNNLKIITNLHDKPWIIAGVFNEMLVDGDKFGGRAVSANQSLIFKDCLDSCNMIDLGFWGPRFTWSNRRDILNLIQERIDRIFVNPNWCALHPNARGCLCNIFAKKNRVMARLGGVPKALMMNPSSSLLALENRLHSKLNDILRQEEELWVQKS
ncbi:uncharacterized protein LOC142627031 [Castanea sativa]|uniref:uncharacterized protein LOC142627031 n=1 Tax=Castanea sativa TaxID=21020 RepID=UPI003F651DF4